MSLTPKQAHWHALIESWQSSGLTQTAFCQQHQLKLPTFRYWVKRCRSHLKSEGQAGPHASAFVPLAMASITPAAAELIEIQLAACQLKVPLVALAEVLTQLKQGGWL